MLELLLVVVGVVAAACILLFAIMDRAKQEDRASRHIQHGLNPFAAITITKNFER
jgi:hypothetical protein